MDGTPNGTAFQSAPACERATAGINASLYSRWAFQSAPACERATSESLASRRVLGGHRFNPRPRVSGRHGLAGSCFDRCIKLFQSAPACERATVQDGHKRMAHRVFQSAPACERATSLRVIRCQRVDEVSIRARV